MITCTIRWIVAERKRGIIRGITLNGENPPGVRFGDDPSKTTWVNLATRNPALYRGGVILAAHPIREDGKLRLAAPNKLDESVMVYFQIRGVPERRQANWLVEFKKGPGNFHTLCGRVHTELRVDGRYPGSDLLLVVRKDSEVLVMYPDGDAGHFSWNGTNAVFKVVEDKNTIEMLLRRSKEYEASRNGKEVQQPPAKPQGVFGARIEIPAKPRITIPTAHETIGKPVAEVLTPRPSEVVPAAPKARAISEGGKNGGNGNVDLPGPDIVVKPPQTTNTAQKPQIDPAEQSRRDREARFRPARRPTRAKREGRWEKGHAISRFRQRV